MSATIIDGKAIAQQILSELRQQINEFSTQGLKPGLAVIVVGDDPASHTYVKNKQKACQEIGVESYLYAFPQTVTQREIQETVVRLNKDNRVHGILIQLPLPQQLSVSELINAIAPEKDVDCFHPYNFGAMALDEGNLLPCTPAGVIELLKRSDVKIASRKCVVIGKSNIVGKPLSLLLLHEGATVTVCHSKTADLVAECRRADILVSAVGKAGLIRADMVKKGAVVIDVGIVRNPEGKLVGDVDFSAARKSAGAITPVPGGVGPMTIAMLMRNVVKAAEMLWKKAAIIDKNY